MSAPGAVIIGGYANAVSALRGLAREGVRTAVILTREQDIAQHSRYAHETHRVHYLNRRPDGLIDLLEAQREHWKGWSLIPTNDYALTALAGHREQLSPWYGVTAPAADVVERVVDKATTYRLAREVGIDVPCSYGPATPATAARGDIAFPVVVKPLEGARFFELFGKKLLVARDRAELTAAVERVQRSGIQAEVFDLVPGPDRNVCNYTVYVDQMGRPAAELGVRKLRKSPQFYGCGRAAEVADLSHLRERTLALLQRIGWRGMASVEYKIDQRDGSYRLMEVNGRCFLINALPTRCGINYPLLAWREHSLRERVRAEYNGWRGTWLHLHADLLYTAMEDREPDWSWGEFLRGYSGPWVDAVWSSKDPIPFLAQWAGSFRKAAHGVRHPEDRKLVRERFQPMPVPLVPSFSTEAR